MATDEALVLAEAEPGDKFVLHTATGQHRVHVPFGGVEFGRGPWDTRITARDKASREYVITFMDDGAGAHPMVRLPGSRIARRVVGVDDVGGLTGELG